MKSLTMNIYINAWLDCSNPFISIHNKFDDDLLAYFNADKVTQLINDGELSLEDLTSTDVDVQMEIVARLMAMKSGEAIKKQIHDMSSSLIRRESTLNTEVLKTSVKSSFNGSNLFPPSVLYAI